MQSGSHQSSRRNPDLLTNGRVNIRCKRWVKIQCKSAFKVMDANKKAISTHKWSYFIAPMLFILGTVGVINSASFGPEPWIGWVFAIALILIGGVNTFALRWNLGLEDKSIILLGPLKRYVIKPDQIFISEKGFIIKDKEQIYFFSNDYHMFNNDLVNEFLSRYKKISISNFKYTLMKYSIGAYIVSNDERKSN